MKKVLFTILACLFAGATVAQAEVSFGLSVGGGEYDASGKESYGSKQQRGETVSVPVASIFAEYTQSLDAVSISVGVDYIPYDIESETVENKRINGSTNTASVDIEDHVTGYIHLSPAGSPVFLRVGYSHAEAMTTENIKNLTSIAGQTVQDTYGNDDLVGMHYGIGYDHEVADGFFIRGLAQIHEYDDITVRSSSGNNAITASLDGHSVTLQVGKSF